MTTTLCALPGCDALAPNRCARCREVHYCSADHQKQHWKVHKHTCTAKKEDSKTSVQSATAQATKTTTTTKEKMSSANPRDNENPTSSDEEKRVCRCMFCGQELVFRSEEEAIDHMRDCPALQEQLNSEEQFTLPKSMR
jgi:hypothetical protein